MKWPYNKEFAFSIFDDTDEATLKEASIVYAFLSELGFRTTKSVWIFNSPRGAVYPGVTCEDPNYLAWLTDMQKKGFEIGLHNVAAASSNREKTLKGIHLFHQYFGMDPAVHTNHMGNLENIYWGTKRLSDPLATTFYRIATIKKNRRFYGDEEDSAYFWGDTCMERISYVRNFVFTGINTLRKCPQMPYHDPEKPYVNYWFTSSDGGDVERFLRALRSIDKLQQEKGACIMYTHFANGFVRNGKLDTRFARAMEDLARRPGWFVPVGTLLNWLRNYKPGNRHITKSSLRQIEYRWLIHQILAGGTR